MNPTVSKKRMVIVAGFMATAIFGLSYMQYREMVTPIPEFESLKQISADGIRCDIARPRGGIGQISFEFFDQNGKRYQTDYMEAAEAKAIEDALERGGVMLFVGRWKAAFESNSIFSIYHMTRGDQVLIDYKNLAESKKTDQQNAVYVTALVILISSGAVAFALWISYKLRRHFSADNH
jgi:hypothetical protein